MPILRTTGLKSLLLLLATAGLAACGGGGGGGDGGGSGGSSGGGGGSGGGSGNVTISGNVTYDFVPVANGVTVVGLDYANTESRPVRLARVQYVAGTAVLATGQTDINGDYSLTVPANRTGFVRVLAQSQRAGVPGWNFRVVDNTSSDAVYALDGSSTSSGSGNSVRNLHATSGWTGTAYGDDRVAAPFAILDTIYIGTQYILDATSITLPPLDIHWSEDNEAFLDPEGNINPETGEIGGTFFGLDVANGLDGLFLLGEEDFDTEEYDRHVILHEYGHYIIESLSRGDNIGGPHAEGDLLDLRVAFNEGWPTAFASLALDDPIYTDTGGFRQGSSFVLNVEADGNVAPGWYSEESVWQLVYDLVDDSADDPLSFEFADILDVMTGPVADTRAVMSIFAFWDAVKDANPADVAQLDALTSAQSIDPIQNEFGTGETNDAGSVDVLPVYTEVLVNGPPVNVCSTNEFMSPVSGSHNKLSARRFLRFTPVSAGQITVTATATDIPAGEYADPDWIVWNAGTIFVSEDEPNAACQAMVDPADCAEPDPDLGAVAVPVQVQEYTLEVYEWTNTLDAETFPDFPPIGRTCFDVTVTQL